MKQIQGTFKADEFWLNKKDKLGWIKYPAFADIKHDGEYCVADTRVSGGVLINSYGKARTDCPILQELPEDSVFYGELTWNGGYNGDLYSLLSHKMDDEIRMYVFDASVLHGTDISHLPFMDRRELLLNAIAPNPDSHVYVVMSTYCETEQDALKAFDQAVSYQYEGVVIKQANQRLLFGASCTWVKLKYEAYADLPIAKIDQTKERIECLLPNGRTVGVKVMNNVKIQLQVGDMVEIRHFGVLSGGSLRHPCFERKRDPNKRISIDP